MVVAEYYQSSKFTSAKGMECARRTEEVFLILLQTLILTYVTIPARSRVSTQLLESPACLAHYSVREVVLRRFVPARMRD